MLENSRPPLSLTSGRANAIRASMNRIVMISLSSLIVIIIGFLAIKQASTLIALEKSTRDEFAKEFQQQDNLFKVEAYLGQWRAIEIRSQMIVDRLKERHPVFDFCILVEVNHADVLEPFAKEICSPGISLNEATEFKSTSIGDVNKPLGSVRFLTRKQFGLKSIITPEIIGVVSIALVFVLILNQFLVRRLDIRIVQPLLAELSEKAQHEAIAKTVQMLAHDIRAPFSSLQTFLKVLQSKPDPEKLSQLVDKLVPEVAKKRKYIEDLLKDILELGAKDAHLSSWEQVSVSELFASALDQVFQVDKESDISLIYNIENISVMVDRVKVQRVIENILFNAKQAMGFKGCITMGATVDRFGIAQITIHNENSFIAVEDREQIFDLFYTKGKKKGTGLGLAIAKKVVQEHEGAIRCESSMKEGTTFIVLLPRASMLPGSLDPLPPSSRTIYTYWRDSFIAVPSLAESKDAQHIAALQKYVASRQKRKLRIGIIDDEEVYINSLEHIVSSDAALAGIISTVRINIGQATLMDAIKGWFDALIVDVDIGLPFDGNWLSKQIKEVSPSTKICIHSNRSSPEDYRAALDAGADSFLPKPMTKSHLITFMYASVVSAKEIN